MSTPVHYDPNELDPYLYAFRRRLKLRDGWISSQQTLFFPSLTAVVIQVTGRLLPIERLWLWTLLPFVIWILALILYRLFQPLSLFKTALNVDIELGLKERLSTAYELKNLPEQALVTQPSNNVSTTLSKSNSAYDEKILYAQRLDAINAAAGIQPASAFPLNFLRRHLAAGLALILVSVALAIFPNSQNLTLQQRVIVKRALEQQAQQIDQLKEEIENQDLSPETQEALLRQLEELAKALKQNPGDLEQALAEISHFEEDIKRRVDPNLAAKESLIQSLADTLAQTTGMEKDQNSHQLAEQALEKLNEALGSMDPKQSEQLSKELARLSAQAGQSGDANLAQALSALAQATQTGDVLSAQNAAKDLRKSLVTTQAQILDQNALQSAVTQAQLSQQALAQTARQVAQITGQSNQPGARNQNSPGQSAAPVVSGGGTRAKQLPPAVGGRNQVRPRGNAPEAPATKLESQVYAPWQHSSGGNQQLYVPGQATNQGETNLSKSQNPNAGLPNPALVPYNQVYYNYLNVANQAIEQGEIPGHLQDYVREYFSSLEP